MKATLSMIRSAAQGCARVEETETGIHFYRFTKAQEDFYCSYNGDFYWKSFATAGVRLEFVTDSTTLSLDTACILASSRKDAFHDIFCNGQLIAHLGGEVLGEVAGNETCFEGTFHLGNGAKTIQIYFPWCAVSVLRALELDDGATFSPVKRPNQMLIFGDSITHGYDAFYPSQTYTSILANKLNANARNKGIGGEKFVPQLLDEPEDNNPTVITVAYGTNDWATLTLDELENGIKNFYSKLSATYPNAKIFAISPIWRSNENEETKAGKFLEVHERIVRLTENLPNVTVLNGYYLVPHDKSMFSDGLHPNAVGSAYYGLNLAEKILKLL